MAHRRSIRCRDFFTLCVLHRHPTNSLAGNNQLHNLSGAIADLQAHHVTHALLVGHIHAVTHMAVGQNAIVQHVNTGFWKPPLAHGGFAGVGDRSAGLHRRVRLVQHPLPGLADDSSMACVDGDAATLADDQGADGSRADG